MAVETYGLLLVIITVALFSFAGIHYVRKKKLTVEDFISSRNSLKAGATTITLVATSMGAWILFGPAEAAILNGVTALIGYAVGSALALFVFIWIGSKLRSLMPKGHSLTEYVYHRYGIMMYMIVLIVTGFYMAVFLAAELTGIALATQLVFGIPLLVTAIVVGIGTLLYAAIGGLKATLFTDRIQGMLLLPLLALIFVASFFFIGNFNDFFNNLNSIPRLLDLTHVPGLEFGLTLIIAIIGANLFHQGYWQRVWVPKTTASMKRAFLGAGIIVLPIILVAGFFGFFSIINGTANNPSIALFTFLLQQTPAWVILVGMVLAITLIMSSMDSLLSGLVSLFMVDVARMKPYLPKKNLLQAAQWFTVIIAGSAIIVATQGYSVLYLFLIADLVCVAAVVPTFLGLYAKKFSGTIAALTTIIGIVAGAMYFPDPTFSSGNLLYSFGIALLVPAILSAIFLKLGEEFDFNKLKDNVAEIE